jgi:hypothetical protein
VRGYRENHLAIGTKQSIDPGRFLETRVGRRKEKVFVNVRLEVHKPRDGKNQKARDEQQEPMKPRYFAREVNHVCFARAA